MRCRLLLVRYRAACRGFPNGPVPVFRRRHPHLFLHVPAEIRKRRKIHPLGDVLQGDFLLAEQACYLVGRKAVYPIRGRLAARLLADFGQIVRGYAELGGVVRKAAVLDVFLMVEQLDEPPQQVAVAFRQVVSGPAFGMNVVQVKNMRQQQVAHHFFPKPMPILGKAFADAQQVLHANAVVMGREPHHRIHQQRQMPYDAIVAAYGHGGNERLGKAHDDGFQVLRFREIRCQRRVGKDDIIPPHHIVAHILKREAHIPGGAEDMHHMVGVFRKRIIRNGFEKLYFIPHSHLSNLVRAKIRIISIPWSGIRRRCLPRSPIFLIFALQIIITIEL